MKHLIFAAALLASPAAAMAQPNPPHFLLGPGTYAARALCPPTLNLTAWSDDTPSQFPIGIQNQFCVNGRIGITFTVPPGPMLNVPITLGLGGPVRPNPRVVVNPDCAEGVETTCTAVHIPGQLTATASGVFTYPGDVDWILLPDDQLYDTIRFTARANCYASGKVVIVDGRQYLTALGGPASCAYRVTATARPEPPAPND